MAPWALLEILLTSAVTSKQWFLHENEIEKYLRNYKYWHVNQDNFRKVSQASTNFSQASTNKLQP